MGILHDTTTLTALLLQHVSKKYSNKKLKNQISVQVIHWSKVSDNKEGDTDMCLQGKAAGLSPPILGPKA